MNRRYRREGMPPLSSRPRTVLFDLDGTLTDPAPGITRCLAFALREIGVPVPEYEVLRSMIGPPWEHELPSIGVPVDRVGDALAAYRSQYEVGGLYEAVVYDGIVEVLGALRDDGFTIALATSKPVDTATRVLEHFGLRPYFDVVGAATLDGTRSHKHDVIAWVIDELGHADMVMVGDRRYDILGARHHGLPCIAVSWGHADEGEIELHQPAHTVDHPAQILDVLRCLPA